MPFAYENLDYPKLNEVPEYKAAVDRMNRLTCDLASCHLQVEAIQKAMAEKKAFDPLDQSVVEAAERAMSGVAVASNKETIRALSAKISLLESAIKVQQNSINRLEYELGDKAAERFRTEHKARAARLVRAVVELRDANESVVSLEDSIEAMGYRKRLPAMRFNPTYGPIDPFDKYGGYAPAWYKETKAYSQTAEEKEAESAAFHEQRIRQQAEYRLGKAKRTAS